MNEYLKVDSITAIASMIAVLSTIVGLVVWLVKSQTRRANDVTDKFFSHLQERAEKSERIHERYADSFANVGESISKQTQEISKQTAQLGELTGKVGDLAMTVAKNQCMASQPAPVARTNGRKRT